jgi:hypothetical protein
MSDPEPRQEVDPGEEGADEEEFEEEPRNPFDNPYFLPVLLAGFALWCGWDGFISQVSRAPRNALVQPHCVPAARLDLRLDDDARATRDQRPEERRLLIHGSPGGRRRARHSQALGDGAGAFP